MFQTTSDCAPINTPCTRIAAISIGAALCGFGIGTLASGVAISNAGAAGVTPCITQALAEGGVIGAGAGCATGVVVGVTMQTRNPISALCFADAPKTQELTQAPRLQAMGSAPLLDGIIETTKYEIENSYTAILEA